MVCLNQKHVKRVVPEAIFLFGTLFALTAFLLLSWAVEKKLHDWQQKDFSAVIHVNGIRGKTSTSRLLDAALRGRYRVFTKTTGTDAVWIGTDGEEHPVRRLGPANIREQLVMLRKAHRQRAEIVILECMAVQPELQKICQEQIVQSGITVITNIRRDHLFELGESPEEIAASLSETVPVGGTVYTADGETARLMEPYCQERHCKLILCGQHGTVQENVEIALAVAEQLGVDRVQAKTGIDTYYKNDFGVQREYSLPGDRAFLNLFSVNDPDSTRMNLERVRAGRELAFLFNHRYDRPDRLLLFCGHFFPYYQDATIYCTGQGAHLMKRFLKNCRTAIVPVENWYDCIERLTPGSLLVGVGSIKGEGYRMVQELERSKNDE